MKRDLLLTAIMLVCVWCLPLSLCAQEEVQCLAVECADGETDYFALAASPVITCGQGKLNITQSGADAFSIADLAFDDVSQCYLTSAVPTSGDSGDETGLQSITTGNALMTGLTAGANVYVYTADGQTVLAATAGNDGTVRVDLSSLKGGQVYILRTPGATYKIVK